MERFFELRVQKREQIAALRRCFLCVNIWYNVIIDSASGWSNLHPSSAVGFIEKKAVSSFRAAASHGYQVPRNTARTYDHILRMPITCCLTTAIPLSFWEYATESRGILQYQVYLRDKSGMKNVTARVDVQSQERPSASTGTRYIDREYRVYYLVSK